MHRSFLSLKMETDSCLFYKRVKQTCIFDDIHTEKDVYRFFTRKSKHFWGSEKTERRKEIKYGIQIRKCGRTVKEGK